MASHMTSPPGHLPHAQSKNRRCPSSGWDAGWDGQRVGDPQALGSMVGGTRNSPSDLVNILRPIRSSEPVHLVVSTIWNIALGLSMPSWTSY